MDVRQDYMLNKFTLVGKDGAQQFQRNNKTRLVDVHKEMERKIQAEFTPTRYGASMMKMGRGMTDSSWSWTWRGGSGRGLGVLALIGSKSSLEGKICRSSWM